MRGSRVDTVKNAQHMIVFQFSFSVFLMVCLFQLVCSSLLFLFWMVGSSSLKRSKLVGHLEVCDRFLLRAEVKASERSRFVASGWRKHFRSAIRSLFLVPAFMESFRSRRMDTRACVPHSFQRG